MTILDTNVISELMRPVGSADVFRWTAQQNIEQLYTTSINEAEVFYGLELVSKGKRRDALFAAAERLFGTLLENRVLAFDSGAARAYSRILAHRRRSGRPMGLTDAQIAAIAHVYGAAIATRDVADFTHCGVQIINPWNT